MRDLLRLLNRNPAVSIGALAIVGFGLGSGAVIDLVRGVLPKPAPSPSPASTTTSPTTR